MRRQGQSKGESATYIEQPAQHADCELAASGGHVCNRAPLSAGAVAPLRAFERGVAAAHRVEQVTKHADTEAVAPGRHGGDGSPAVGAGVVALRGTEGGLAAVEPADGVQKAIHHADAQVVAWHGHVGNGAPAARIGGRGVREAHKRCEQHGNGSVDDSATLRAAKHPLSDDSRLQK